MMPVGRQNQRPVRLALCLVAPLWLAGCSSSHTPNPPPDPEFVAAARAERERAAMEREQEAAERAELERMVRGIERQPRLLSEDELYTVLEYYCGECHFPTVNSWFGDGFYHMDDLDVMINEGKVNPGDGEGSRLVQRMREGSMPPVSSGEPPVPDATIDRIVDFIDSLDIAPSEE
jgi:hypothetical protein